MTRGQGAQGQQRAAWGLHSPQGARAGSHLPAEAPVQTVPGPGGAALPAEQHVLQLCAAAGALLLSGCCFCFLIGRFCLCRLPVTGCQQQVGPVAPTPASVPGAVLYSCPCSSAWCLNPSPHSPPPLLLHATPRVRKAELRQLLHLETLPRLCLTSSPSSLCSTPPPACLPLSQPAQGSGSYLKEPFQVPLANCFCLSLVCCPSGPSEQSLSNTLLAPSALQQPLARQAWAATSLRSRRGYKLQPGCAACDANRCLQLHPWGAASLTASASAGQGSPRSLLQPFSCEATELRGPGQGRAVPAAQDPTPGAGHGGIFCSARMTPEKRLRAAPGRSGACCRLSLPSRPRLPLLAEDSGRREQRPQGPQPERCPAGPRPCSAICAR